MAKTYVEQRDGGYYVAGERVSLGSLIYAFRRGASPEQTAEEAGLRGLPDPEVLARAADDRRTMPAHFADFIRQRESPGVSIISQRVSVRRAMDELALVWEASEAEEWTNLIVQLPL